MIKISTRLEEKLQVNSLFLQLDLADDQNFLSNQLLQAERYSQKHTHDKTKSLPLTQTKIHKLLIYTAMIIAVVLISSFTQTAKSHFDHKNQIPKNVQPPSLRQIQKDSDSNQNIFHIQHNYWIFQNEREDQTYLDQLILQNHYRYAEASGFTVHVINQQNYRLYLQKRRAEELTNLISELKIRANDPNQKSNLKQHITKIIKTVTLLNILADNGGIMVTDKFLLSENFSWIKHIKDNIYVNRGNHFSTPQVVGFYAPPYTFPQQKEQKKHHHGMEEVDKYMSIFPSLQNYFLAAKKQSEFIIQMVHEINDILLDPSQMQKQLARKMYSLSNFQGKDIYYEYFILATQKILQSKQKQLDLSRNQYNYRKFAIDSYGLFLINCFYGPFKLKHFWKQKNTEKIFQNLARYDQVQLQASIGPLRYLTFVSPQTDFNKFLNDAQNKKNQGILRGSFLQKVLYPQQHSKFIYNNKQISIVNQTAQPWVNLPRLIWIYWDTGLKNSQISNQLFAQNLKRTARQSNFSLIQVNDTNVRDYLQQQVLQKINRALNQAKVIIYPQTKSDLYRLALLASHGGIYLDSSYIALQDLDWLVNIGKHPSQYIFNRYGYLPKVLMMFHPHFGGPFEWTFSQQYNTKASWHLAYENNMIIAQKGAQLIQEWLDLFLNFLQTPYEQISQTISSYGLSYHKWINSENQYLLAMDTIKCVIGRRQKQLSQDKELHYADASDYYKIWAMSGYLGQQKLRYNTNYANYAYEDNNNNVFLTRYSQDYVQGLIGKIRHFTKFYHDHNNEINKFILQNMQDFSQQTHSKSIFMKYIFDESVSVYSDSGTLKLKSV